MVEHTPAGKYVGLLLGINSYIDPIPSLRFAAADAKELYDLLISPLYNFSTNRLILLESTNSENNHATRRNILRQLHRVAESAQDGDMLLFYYSGHGMVIEESPYLCPSDTEAVDLLEETAIPLTKIREIIATSKASVKIMIFDACHLGVKLGVKAFIQSPKEFGDQAKHIFQDIRGIAMLASSALEETSIEIENKKHGIFTYFLIEALKDQVKLDQNSDRYISVTEIFNYVTTRLSDYKQQPTIVLEGSGDLPIFHLASVYSAPNPIRRVFPSPVKDPKDFFGRIDELRQTRDQLLNTSDILIFVHGERCVGKTSFFNRVKSMLDEESCSDVHFLHFSIEPSSMSTVADFAQELWDSLKGVCQSIPQSSFEAPPFLFQGYSKFGFELADLLRPLTTYRFVVFIDEIQKIKNITDNVAFNQIIGLLRYIIEQTSLPIAFVVSSFENQQQFFPSSFGSPPSSLEIEIAPLDRGDCDVMLASLFVFESEMINTLFEPIYRLSGGHPHVAKMLAAEIYGVVQQTPLENLFLEPAWQEVITKTANATDALNLFSSLYAHFSNDERYVLLSLALRPEYSISGQETALWRVNHRGAASQLEKSKYYLLRTPDGGYCLRLQLLGEWLKNWQGFSLEAERFGLVSPSNLQIISNEGICIEEASGKVYLNGKEVESKLSDLQYQLLVYMVRNVDRVVSRQNLYEFLHSKDETYLSTDQSLDALVYRLRLALGDKEQQYLQTLRNRGYLLKQATIISK